MVNHKKQPTHVTKIRVDHKSNFYSEKIPVDKKEYRQYKIYIIKNNINRIFKKITGVFVKPVKLIVKKIVRFVKFIKSTPPIYSLPEFIKPHVDKDGNFKYRGTKRMTVIDNDYSDCFNETFAENGKPVDGEVLKESLKKNISDKEKVKKIIKTISEKEILNSDKKEPFNKDISENEEVKNVIKTISEMKKSKEYVRGKVKPKQTKNKPKSSKSHKKSTKKK